MSSSKPWQRPTTATASTGAPGSWRRRATDGSTATSTSEIAQPHPSSHQPPPSAQHWGPRPFNRTAPSSVPGSSSSRNLSAWSRTAPNRSYRESPRESRQSPAGPASILRSPMPTSVRPTRQRGPELNPNDLASRFRSLALVSRAREDGSSGNPATATRIPPVEGKHNIDNIRNFVTQDAYFAYIQDQVQAYRATYGDQVLEVTSPNSPHVTTQRAAADEIVGAFRKLREGVTAARRQDETAVRIYEASVEMCIRAGHDSELLKSFGPLLDDLYPHFASAQEGIPSPATTEATGRPAPPLVAALQRRSEMTAYYYLFLLSQYARRILSNDIHQAATDRNVSTELDRQAQQYYIDYRSALGAIKSGTKELDMYQSFTLQLLRLVSSFDGYLDNEWLQGANTYQKFLIRAPLDYYRLRILQFFSRVYYSLRLDDLCTFLALPDTDHISQLMTEAGVNGHVDRPPSPDLFSDPVKPDTLTSPERPTLKVWFKKKPILQRPM